MHNKKIREADEVETVFAFDDLKKENSKMTVEREELPLDILQMIKRRGRPAGGTEERRNGKAQKQ